VKPTRSIRSGTAPDLVKVKHAHASMVDAFGLHNQTRSPRWIGVHEMTLLANTIGALVAQWRLLALNIGRLFTSFEEPIRDRISMKVLELVSIPLGRELLYFSYRQYRQGEPRLFVGIRDIEGTRFQEIKIEPAIRLREFLDQMNETGEIDVPFANGNFMRLRRGDNSYPWLKARENAASQGKRLPLFINLEGSGNDRFKEVSMPAAALIVDALDGFFSLAGEHQKN
jgi:hypothetical protein